jgi:hypothetical protein
VLEALVELDMSLALAGKTVAGIGLDVGKSRVGYNFIKLVNLPSFVKANFGIASNVLITGPASPLALPPFFAFFLSWPAIVEYACIFRIQSEHNLTEAERLDLDCQSRGWGETIRCADRRISFFLPVFQGGAGGRCARAISLKTERAWAYTTIHKDNISAMVESFQDYLPGDF